MLKIVTTVGTSLFENKYKEDAGFRNLVARIENRSASEYNNFQDEIDKIRLTLIAFISSDPRTASAELTSTQLIRQKYRKSSSIVLIASDTLISTVAAEVINEYFNNLKDDFGTLVSQFVRNNTHVIKDLQVSDKSRFENSGLINLINNLHKFLISDLESLDNKQEVTPIMNITGGFKGVIPYLTIFAQMRRIKIVYSFEKSDELIEIPVLPIEFDSSFTEKFFPVLEKTISGSETEKSELIRLGFLEKNGNKTKLGSLLIDYENRRLSSSRNIIGLVVEYKLMEYYSTTNYSDYKVVTRSDEFLGANKLGGEIDIVLKKDKYNINLTKFVCIEVKSLAQLLSPLSKTTHQLKAKIELMIVKKAIPDEFHFVIYGFNPLNDNEIKEIGRKGKVAELSRIITEKLPGVKVKFFFAKFKLKPLSVTKNPYEHFIKEKLEKNISFIEITHGVQNV